MKTVSSKLLLAAALTTASSAFAAEGLAGFGLHGGINLSKVSIERTGGATLTQAKNNTNGFLLGAHGEFGIDFLTLRPEINYRTQGYSYANLVDVSRKFLEIPVLVKLGWMTGPVQIFAEAGPQVSFALSTSASSPNGTTVTYKPEDKKMDISGIAGAGLGIGVSDSMSIDLEGRYVFGFLDQSSSSDVHVKTRGWQILAGLTFKK